MTTAQLFDDGQLAGPTCGEPAVALAPGEAAHGNASPEPGWGREDGGADAFALSKRLRYLDWMAGFDGARRAA